MNPIKPDNDRVQQGQDNTKTIPSFSLEKSPIHNFILKNLSTICFELWETTSSSKVDVLQANQM